MKHLRESATLKKASGGGSASGTMVSRPAGASSSVAPSADFNDFYRTGKRLEMLNVTAASPVSELKSALSSLNRAYEEERAQLERFYDRSREQIKTLITRKEKK